ncbi:TonB-dependent receptor plug domain-containing protein [Steroidobacter cummioxidans]|uniref:TonB-dependent receptor plug domain-containing protein n=1 Tax=Steroidobacter cummioxidans TaxID=1803913 RepID=UPI001379834E|nr:TonB-dependent receptor [Steroidobacter cummioxidans]
MAWAQLTAAQSSSAGPEYSLSIPSGSLTKALDQFSKQTGLQVAAELTTPELQQHPVNAVVGRFSAAAALEQLLAGSELTYVWVDSSTVKIHLGAVPPEGEGGQRGVVVTGSRLDGGEGPAPVRVYGREEIERLGVSSLPGLATYLTQQPFSFGEWAQRSGAQHFQMRGLGVDTTLVLINGRRAPPSATSVTLNAFDLNTVPLTAVERIEVMSDSASAIYGSDAIGGVVNIILKEDVTAPVIYLHYGGADGGGVERRVAVSAGGAWQRFRSSLTLDYLDRTMLIGAERELWSNQDFRRFGGKDYRLTTAPRANVYSLSGASLPGLPASQASVPFGSSGIGLRPEDFLATAGAEHASLYSADQMRSIEPDLKRLSAVGSAEYTLGEKTSIFGEMLATKSDVLAQGFLFPVLGQIVPADNPYNPFGQPVRVDFSLAGTKPLSIVTEAQNTRFVLGARGDLSRWDWEVALTSSDGSVDVERINELNLSLVQAALRSTEPQTALNPFVDGPAGSDALLSSLMRAPQASSFFSRQLQLSGFVRGPMFELPGGMSEFVFGGELRHEEVRTVDTTRLEQERDIVSEFAEFRLPVLKGLSLKLALRADTYEQADDSVNPQYGLVWRPNQDWLVRAAYGTSFRPPSLLELATQTSELPLVIADPRRGGSISPVRLTVGGNPDLGNVSAHSFTGGVVYRLSQSPGLHWGAHYWRVVMNNRIFVPRTTDLERIEEKFPSRVSRAVQTEADRMAGWPGALQSLDISLINYGRLDTSGVDLDLSYRVAGKLGQLQAALSATWVNDYAARDLTPLPTADRVGIANLLGTVPEWRLVGSLTWDGSGWGASTTTTFTPRYRDADLTGVLNRHLPSRTIFDVQAWLALDRLFDPALFHSMKLTAGALNVFDEDVDFANVGLGLGFDISQADLRQRFAYLRITKSF